MTSNSDNDFSLKEWVMKRAANQSPGEAVYKTAAVANTVGAERPRKDGLTRKDSPSDEKIL